MGGIIKNIELGLIYDKYDYLFKDFVDDFMELRKENDIMNTFGKLVINSLYGRLGMNDMNNEILIIEKNQFEEIYASIKKKIFSFNIVNDCVIIDMKTDKKIRVKGNVTLASSITSKARIKLYNAQQDVIKNKGKLLYSDTDSVYACYDKDVSKEKHGILD
jgi:DNA polymerase elongation subunit (family B)